MPRCRPLAALILAISALPATAQVTIARIDQPRPGRVDRHLLRSGDGCTLRADAPNLPAAPRWRWSVVTAGGGSILDLGDGTAIYVAPHLDPKAFWERRTFKVRVENADDPSLAGEIDIEVKPRVGSDAPEGPGVHSVQWVMDAALAAYLGPLDLRVSPYRARFRGHETCTIEVRTGPRGGHPYTGKLAFMLEHRTGGYEGGLDLVQDPDRPWLLTFRAPAHRRQGSPGLDLCPAEQPGGRPGPAPGRLRPGGPGRLPEAERLLAGSRGGSQDTIAGSRNRLGGRPEELGA
jgi:hypothetical protein